MDDSLPLYPQAYNQYKVNPSEASSPTMSQPKPASTSTPIPIITHQPVLLGPENTVTTCQFCHASIKTAVKYTATSRTHMAAALCSALCLCCLPYSLDTAKNADHYCPNCQRYLGTYHR